MPTYWIEAAVQCSVVWWWRGNDSAKMTAGMQPVCWPGWAGLGSGLGWLGWAAVADHQSIIRLVFLLRPGPG